MTEPNRPWLDATKPVDARVQLLIDAMTTEEKVAQMIQISYSVVTADEADAWARRGTGSVLHVLGDNARRLQRIATESRLGIPLIFGIDAIHGHAIHNGATVFPTQLALAASWDPELAERVGEVTAREVAAEGLHWAFSPVFCLGRDLRWGRIDETFGEDPYLAGKLGAGIIRGYQGDGVKADPRATDRIIACAKHYIAYGESTGGRDSYNAPVSMRSLRSTFLPPFAEAVKAGCQTFMAGYEPIDGTPVSASKKILTDILKTELGFDGFVVTDWSNVTSLMSRQKFAGDLKEASRIALEAGNDMIMTTPEFYDSVLALLAEGRANIADVDRAVARVLTVKFRAGLFDVPQKVKTLPIASDPTAAADARVFGCDEHSKVNLEAARKSIVLLKNAAVRGMPALPLRGKAEGRPGRAVRRIAVIGPNADSVRAQFGDWTFFTHPVSNLGAKPTFHVTTMLEGIRSLAAERGIEVLFDKGCDIADATNKSIAKAVKLASRADAVILAVGDCLQQTGEAHDRANLALTGAQNELARALRTTCDAKKTPLVSLFVNGKPLEFATVAACSDAIVETFNSGTLGGQATAEVLFGEINPEGRLPISFPHTTGQLPVYYNQLPGWHDGAYFDCPREPLFAFGEGLSYTEFRYDGIALSSPTARASDTVDVRVTVTNTGDREGTETVQVYVADRLASVLTPVRELKAFAKVRLAAGETTTVSIPLAVESLAVITADERRVVEPGEFEIQAGHDSRPTSLIQAVLTVVE